MDDLARSVATLQATPFTEWHALRNELPASVNFDAAVAAVVATWTTAELHIQSQQALTDAAADLLWAATLLPTGLKRFAELLGHAEWLVRVAQQLVLGEHPRIPATGRNSAAGGRASGSTPRRAGPSSAAAAALGGRSNTGGSR